MQWNKTMKKIYWIHNTVFLPLLNGDKYINASISGIVIGEQFTLEEIKSKFPGVKEANDLHSLCKAWGSIL
jgi:hypothetical protein